MVIDSSALLALLLGEPETAEFLAAIADRVVNAPNYVESAIVLAARFGSTAREKLDRLLVELDIDAVPFTREQAGLAIRAYQQYGKGSGHPAELNFGDCFTYALAKLRNEAVLFKGNDFARTDLRSGL